MVPLTHYTDGSSTRKINFSALAEGWLKNFIQVSFFSIKSKDLVSFKSSIGLLKHIYLTGKLMDNKVFLKWGFINNMFWLLCPQNTAQWYMLVILMLSSFLHYH